MKAFEVSITRIAYGMHTIRVEAEDEEAAKEKALGVAGNFLYNEKLSEYSVDSVVPAPSKSIPGLQE